MIVKIVAVKATEYTDKHTWKNPPCGHDIPYNYTVPVMCEECKKVLLSVHRLVGAHNQDVRIKYHLEQKI